MSEYLLLYVWVRGGEQTEVLFAIAIQAGAKYLHHRFRPALDPTRMVAVHVPSGACAPYSLERHAAVVRNEGSTREYTYAAMVRPALRAC